MSLVLLVIVVSLGADLLALQRYALARVAGEARAQTVLRHAAAPLLAHLRLHDPAYPAVVADSVADALSTIADGALCAPADGSARILVAAPVGDDALLAGWRVRPDAGDVVVIALAGEGESEPRSREWRATVTAVDGGGGARCPHDGESPAPGDTPATVVRLAEPPPAGALAGTPVRFARRVRYSLYRTGDGSWALGQRRCGVDPPAACQGVQPVAGPLRAGSTDPALAGMRLAAIDRLGEPTTGAGIAAATVVLRAARATPVGMRRPGSATAAADSVAIHVAMRSAPP